MLGGGYGTSVRTIISEQQADELKTMWSGHFIPIGIKDDQITRSGFTTKYYSTLIETDGKYYLIDIFVSYKN